MLQSFKDGKMISAKVYLEINKTCRSSQVQGYAKEATKDLGIISRVTIIKNLST